MKVSSRSARVARILRRHLLKFAALAPLALASIATAQTVTVLSSTNQLVTYNADTPGAVVSTSPVVNGLVAGDALTSIDYRPVDGVLIGLGYNSASGVLHIYSLSLSTGMATSINANTLTIGTGVTRPIIDFNPSANAIRLTASGSTPNNNYRVPTAGAGALTTDTALSSDPGLLGSAYSRNVPGGGASGATTLYLVSASTLYTQGSVDFFTGSGTSPNTGTINTVATLGGVSGTIVGFDIAATGTAYLATGTTLYTLNLANGAAGTVGAFGGGITARDIAVLPVPEPGTWALIALGAAGCAVVTRRKRPNGKATAV